MQKNKEVFHKQTLKTKARVLLKRMLFGTDVSTVEFRLRRERLRELIRQFTFRANERRDFLNMLNSDYPQLKIKMLDIGSRSGLMEPFIYLMRLNNFYLEGFEPDKAEAEAILKSGKFGNYSKIHPVALSNKSGKIPLYITKMLGCSSIYKPNLNDMKYYTNSNYYEIQKKIIIPVTTLAKIYPNGEQFDFISMDVQGAEHKVLSGGREILKNAIGISFEANFIEIYEKQKLFHDMHKLMLDNDFRLISLGAGDTDGEITECGTCVYIKKNNLIKNKEDLLKRILFSLIWDKKSYAEFLIRNHGDRFLSPAEKREILRKLRIKIKEKMSTKHDGIVARYYEHGEGYM